MRVKEELTATFNFFYLMGRNIFNSVALPRVDSNQFNLSHDVKLSFQMGRLIPTCNMEVLPGDVININVENMLRFAPLISPVMHKVRITTDYFFVPTRLLWAEWDKWIMGGSTTEAPYFFIDECKQGSLGDYLGIPTGDYDAAAHGPLKCSPFPIAAYLKIRDEYYRDQNLQESLFTEITGGENIAYAEWVNDLRPVTRAWEHDYFTSALPFAQKGDAVQVPLTVQDDIPVDYTFDGGTAAENAGLMRDTAGNIITTPGDITVATGPSPLAASVHVDGVAAAYDPNGTLTVDVQSDAVDINTLRRAFRLQEWLEKNARAGTRLVEGILAHFGVKSSDARMQRPEFIGRSKQNMVISEVLATAQNTDETIPVGQMAGHGISVGGGNRFHYRAEEHGYVIGIINVQPNTAYQQGLHRSFTRFDRLDYAWPTFANIGEQEVLQKEVMVPMSGAGSPDTIFGYVPRYAEYKYMNSRVAGEMRSSLSFWHLGRIFATDPALNEVFISCEPSTRIFAVTDPNEDHIFAHIFNNISVRRKLPRYGIPSI